jgi:hypothetical protein
VQEQARWRRARRARRVVRVVRRRVVRVLLQQQHIPNARNHESNRAMRAASSEIRVCCARRVSAQTSRERTC